MSKIDLKNNNEPWLIVTDLDGTFVANTPNFAIPAINVRAVKELNKLGHKFVLASGRSPQLMQFNHDFLGLETPMISFHGAYITDPSGKNQDFALVNNYIEVDTIKDLLQQLNLFDVSTSVHMIGINKALELTTIEDLRELDFVVYEGVIMIKPGASIDIEKVSKMIEERYGDTISYKYLKGGSGLQEDLLLFVARDTDKVHAIKQLSEYYNIPQERIMYFGDNLNDLKAIEYAGVGVAVESGKQEAKDKADYIAKGTNHDGAVGRFILDILQK